MPPADAAAPGKWIKVRDALISPASRRAARAAGLAVPVLLVNAVAFIGQFGYLKDHLPWIVPGIVMAAVALESIAVYLQWHAHLAQLANDSALRLRLASYGVALLVAAMNYSHYAGPNWRPTVAAVLCALMSAASPWLWAIHSRRVSRDALMARGLIEEHAVRLGATRWSWHPIRATRVMNRATWVGETDPRRAIAALSGRYEGLVPPSGTGTPAQQELARPGPEPVPALTAVPEPVPAVHSATVHLVSEAVAPGHRPAESLIDEVEQRLAAMAVTALPTVREVARWLGNESGQRRRAKNMIEARIHDETQKPTAVPPSGARQAEARNIAWPTQFQPGGATG